MAIDTYSKYMDTLVKAVNRAIQKEDEIARRTSFSGSGLGFPGDHLYEKVYNDYLRKLTKVYPYQKYENDPNRLNILLNTIESFPDDKLHLWLQTVGTPSETISPDMYKSNMEVAKVLPLLQGVASEGQDWYSLPYKNGLDRIGADAGYPMGTKEGRSSFFKSLADAQKLYDRAQLLKEYQSKGADYWLPKLFYPATTQEIENAIATGQGGSEETLDKLKDTDFYTNMLIASIPGSTAIKGLSPVVNAGIDALLQGAVEYGIRQRGREALSETGQKASIADAVLAASMGATKPGIVQTVSSVGGQIPGKAVRDFSRGFTAGAMRSSNEAARIEKAIDTYNKIIAPTFKKSAKAEILDNSGDLAEAVKVPDMAKFFGIAPKAEGTYDAKKLLKAYNGKTTAPNTVSMKDGVVVYKRPPHSKLPTAEEIAGKGGVRGWIDDLIGRNQPTSMIGADKIDEYTRLFPDKAANLDAGKTSFGAGQGFGLLLGDIGSRVEPMIKINPLDAYNKKSVRKEISDPYKVEALAAAKRLADKYDENDWKDPKQGVYFQAKRVKDLFDAVFKKKEEDEEE